jgi:hypothetical protein
MRQKKADFYLIDYILRYLLKGESLNWVYKAHHEEIQRSKFTLNKNYNDNKIINVVKV